MQNKLVLAAGLAAMAKGVAAQGSSSTTVTTSTSVVVETSTSLLTSVSSSASFSASVLPESVSTSTTVDTSTSTAVVTGTTTVASSSQASVSTIYSYYNTTYPTVIYQDYIITVCPYPTTITYKGQEYTATETGQTITITNCPCEATSVSSPPSQAALGLEVPARE